MVCEALGIQVISLINSSYLPPRPTLPSIATAQKPKHHTGASLNYLLSSLALARRSSLVPSWGISLWS